MCVLFKLLFRTANLKLGLHKTTSQTELKEHYGIFLFGRKHISSNSFYRSFVHFLIFPAEVLLKNYLMSVKFQKSYLSRSDLL